MGTLWIGNVRTMQSDNDAQEAIYSSNGMIKETGSKDDLQGKFKDEIDRVIDVRPYTIYPGFEDSHLHVMAHGLKLRRLSLTEVSTSEEMGEILKNYSKDKQQGEWIFGEGWNENNWPDRKIFHKNELDQLTEGHPAVLTRVCRHAVIANSEALAYAGITKDTPDPEGGIIVRDNDGDPTGFLLDNAQDLLLDVLPALPQSELEAAAANGVDDLLKKGLIGGHTEDLAGYGSFKNVLNAYQSIIKGMRRFKLHLLVHHHVVEDWAEAGYTLQSKLGSDISFGGMKIFSDGAIGSRTAWLREPYNDAPETCGVNIHQQDALNTLVEQARKHQLPAAIHAIGDQALEAAVSAVEKVPPVENYPDRFIHGQMVPPDLQERISHLNAVLDIQPSFVASDFPWVIERIGNKRLAYCYAWKTLLEKGLHLAGGSDAPIEDPDPLQAIYTAITRENHAHSSEYREKDERLTPFEAIELYTTGSAFAAGAENRRGKIAPGYEANFTICTEDLLTIPISRFLTNEVQMTVVGGQIVYEKI